MSSPERTQELAASALKDAGRRGIDRICIFFDGAVPLETINRLLADPGIASIGAREATDRPDSVADAARNNPLIGRYWEPGAWSLPIWSKHVYWTGSYWLITHDMIRETLRRDVESLRVLTAGQWLPVPLRTIRRAADFRHSIRPFAAIRAARQALGKAVRHLFPNATALALRGKQSLQGVLLERGMRNMLRGIEPASDVITKRVVLVCGNLSPGGAERQVTYTAIGLRNENIESVGVLCHYLTCEHANRYDFYLNKLVESGVTVREIRRRSSSEHLAGLPERLRQIAPFIPAGLLIDIADLYLEFSELKPEIVHAWLDWDNVRAGLAAALAGTPKIILSGRNINPSHFSLYQPYMDPAYRVLATLPNVKLINNSRAGADDYAAWIGIRPERIAVVHNAVDFGNWARPDAKAVQAMREAFGIKPNAFVIGGVFRLEAEKRPLLWIETAAYVAKYIPDAQFILFGQGRMQNAAVRAARQWGLGDRLFFAGVTEDALSAMAMMDVLLLTSFGEGLPNVLLEAQWAGTPVVTTDAGGAKEAIEVDSTGWIPASAEPAQIAERIVWLYEHKDARMRARTRGPQFVQEHFSLKRMIDATLQAYESADNPPAP